MNMGSNLGMAVTVSPQGHHSPGYSLGFNPEKQSIEGSLPRGNYVVEGTAYGPNSTTGSTNLAVSGAPTEGPAMVLSSSGSINVNVSEEFMSPPDRNGSMIWNSGQHSFPVRGPRTYLADIRLESADDFEPQRNGYLRQPAGPDDESLAIENLSPGSYWLRVHPSRGYVASAARDGVDLLHQPLVVGSGSSAPIEIKMRDDTAEIDGTVTGIATSAGTMHSMSPQAWVYCVPLAEGPGQFQELAVSPDGKFNAQNIAPGTYRVLAFQSHFDLPYRDAEAMKAYDSKGQVVHLSPNQKAAIQVAMSSSSE
jgi:WD40 repeat protein